MEFLVEFAANRTIWLYIFIFFGKIAEVALATVRAVLINRGERTMGTVLSFFEIVLWLMVTGTVLQGFTSDIWKGIVYCVAYTTGIYTGSLMESLMAFGLQTVEVILSDKESFDKILAELRDHQGVGITTLIGEGRAGSKWILKMHIKRARLRQITKLIRDISSRAVISATDLRSIYGGYLKSK